MAVYFPDSHYLNFQVFSLQTNRILLYFIFFITGVFTGAYGIERTFLNQDNLSKRWFIWVIIASILCVIRLRMIYKVSTEPIDLLQNQQSLLVPGILFALCCVSCSFAFIAVFLKFMGKRKKMLDSLDKNSYGIYIIHYPLISWLHYSLLGTGLPPIAKGLIVFICALLLCWGVTAAARRIPGVTRVI